MTVLFSFKDIEKSYGDDTLFSGLSVDFKTGERLGLIGMNGSGKSTFLRMIAGLSHPDEGDCISGTALRTVYLPQEDKFKANATVEQVLIDCTKEHVIDEKEQHRIIQKAMGKAGFEEPETNVDSLSGGWKKKLAITRAFCSAPDLLLLDEPTNHLDIDGILWLEQMLAAARFSFIIVSHDRAFLENICSDVMEIAKYYPDGYFKINGQYRKFIKERTKFLTAQEKQQASLASRMRREDEWLRQGPKARTSKAKYRIEQAQQLKVQLNAVKMRNQNAASVDIDFDSTQRKTKKLLRVYNLCKQMAGRQLFSNLTFELTPGFCLGVVGENGSGKSTFLSILANQSGQDSGKVEWVQDLKLAVFDQNRSRLNPDDTLREALNPDGGDSVNFQGRPIHIVTWAKRFLFMPDQLDMPVKNLSGGEKARIMIANIMMRPNDVLLLDEPTNDLDILSLEVLEDSIRQFPGAVVIVSHDRYMMNKVCHRMLYLEPDKPSLFFKNFDQILSHRKKQTAETARPKEKKNQVAGKTRPASFSYKDKYELEQIEDRILEAEEKRDVLSDLVQQPEILSDPERMKKHCQELKTAEETVQYLYDRWEHLEQKKNPL